MKVSVEHIAVLRKAIAPLDTPERRERYCTGQFPRSDAVKDLNKRYRWDLLWESGAANVLYGGSSYKDTHIDTALRSIVPALT